MIIYSINTLNSINEKETADDLAKKAILAKIAARKNSIDAFNEARNLQIELVLPGETEITDIVLPSNQFIIMHVSSYFLPWCRANSAIR